MKPIIFDLDNTLILSDNVKLDSLRRKLVNNSDVSTIEDFLVTNGHLKRITEDFIKHLQLGSSAILAIFSKAPRSYVNYMLNLYYRHIKFDVVIAYEDVKPKFKPNPYGINLVMNKLSIQNASDVIYVGDDYKDKLTAQNAGCKYFNFDWYEKNEDVYTQLKKLEIMCVS